jgi:hypothetical protein
MSIAAYSKFDTYKPLLHALSSPLEDQTLMREPFLLEKDEKKNLEIYYAPFEYVNQQATIVIVGITPGLHQMKMAFSTVMDLKDEMTNNEEILHEVKKRSSFEGTMRKNLIAMLDELQLQNYLGLSSTGEFFDIANHLVHTASVIPYPVFYKGKNFSGSTPNMLKTDLLRRYIIECFASDITTLNNPLIIPLGINVAKVLHFLADNHYIKPNLILTGFPHPSGANGHRHKQFAENKAEIKRRIEAYFRH